MNGTREYWEGRHVGDGLNSYVGSLYFGETVWMWRLWGCDVSVALRYHRDENDNPTWVVTEWVDGAVEVNRTSHFDEAVDWIAQWVQPDLRTMEACVNDVHYDVISFGK